jgi:aldehyde:ferredoxin oxidoreductase
LVAQQTVEQKHAKEINMTGGYMGRFLWVDLSNGSIEIEDVDEDLLHDFVGGYGIAARIYFDRMSSGIDPLGPENILGFTTGPLTGTPAQTGTRWTVTCKSPLTGGWGDANGSGSFGMRLKASGFDAIFVKGQSPEPVFLYVENNHAEIRSAEHLWGRDTYEVDDWVKEQYGKDAEAACIGPSGEACSLVAAVIHAKGRAAGRSGVGAVMGSKRLKAVVVKGDRTAGIAHPEQLKSLRLKYARQMNTGTGFSVKYKTTGTPGGTSGYLVIGDVPTKNWQLSTKHSPPPEAYSFDELLKHRESKMHCWRCPLGCWGTSIIEEGVEKRVVNQPEYETEGAFGPNLLNGDMLSLIKANDICNRYGLDTISAGSCLGFAFECYEKGLITKEDTGGLALEWGNPKTILELLEKVARREDLGAVLADGVMRAAQQIGGGSEQFAVHAGGQELPMHDPRCEPALSVIYKLDATPGRHTQASVTFLPEGFPSDRPRYGNNRANQAGSGRWVKDAYCLNHTMNASGMCLFGYFSMRTESVPEFLSAVTGWEYSMEDVLTAGERIAAIRQAFNAREGINPIQQPDPWRAYGQPALPDGPTAGFTVDLQGLTEEFLDAMGWRQDSAAPSRATLERLGLEDVARVLWD